MNYTVMPDRNVGYLDSILTRDNRLLVLPADDLRKLPLLDLQIWANKRGVYCLPTAELIAWLRTMIGGREAVEICAGNGAIGRALGIVATDSYIQTEPKMAAYYRQLGQQPIIPPPDVQKFEAVKAVQYFKPKVVVGAYVTQLYQLGDEGPPKIGSSVFGVNELLIWELVETYICIGNVTTHGDKRLLKKPHEVYRFDWLFTRSMTPESNVIYVWNKG